MHGIGILRAVEHVLHRRLLHDLAPGHHRHPVRHVADDTQVMGDQDHGHAQLGLQTLQQLQNLRLDGDIQRRCRLVRDQNFRFVGQRHGDHHALPLAAR